jgi:hypothetical protein
LKYVKNKEYDSQKDEEKPYELSKLQKRLLEIICTELSSDYNVLTRKANKRRSTIFQSLQPMLKHHYISADKVSPTQKNSKLTFKITQKGLFYCIAYLEIDYDEIIKSHIDKDTEAIYNRDFIESVPNYAGRKEFIKQTATLLMESKAFDKKGMLLAANIQQIMNWGFRLSILESVKERKFSSKKFFGDLTVEAISKICRPEEKDELIKFLKNMNKNLNSVIAYISNQDQQ